MQAPLSRRAVSDAPQAGQRHHCRPVDVLPLLYILAPLDGHFMDFTADIPQTVLWRQKQGIYLQDHQSGEHGFRPSAKTVAEY